jgi:hypothetical protein
MHGFWRSLVTRYRALGGRLHTGTRVSRVDGEAGAWRVTTSRGTCHAGQVVLAVPAPVARRCRPCWPVRVRRYLERDEAELGGAVLVVLGVPEREVAGQGFTHHQLLQDYDRPLGDGNNMFVSVSAAGDTVSAPPGHRAVMISTHTALADWTGLGEAEYACARRTSESASSSTRGGSIPPWATGRSWSTSAPPGVRAVRLPARWRGRWSTSDTAQQQPVRRPALTVGGRGLWLVGDSTWPGLGTVACVLGSRIVADGVRASAADADCDAAADAGRAGRGPAPHHPAPAAGGTGPALAGVAVFVVVAALGWWWITPLVVFGIFVAVVTATHDVVHRTLGLSVRATDVWLFLLGLVLLESGHAYRMTHRQHHRLFPARTTPRATRPTSASPAPCCTGRCS